MTLKNKTPSRKYEISNGDIEWRNKQGHLHRENGPAHERVDGDKFWFINGLLHRENGPAVERSDGSKEWWINGLRHRENGPAFENRGQNPGVGWFQNGQRHRENGPAVEYDDGLVQFWLNNATGPEVEQQVKENMALRQRQELLDYLSQEGEVISHKVNTNLPKAPKKL